MKYRFGFETHEVVQIGARGIHQGFVSERHCVCPEEAAQDHHIRGDPIVEFIADPGAAENVLALLLRNQESVAVQRVIEGCFAVSQG